MEWTLIHPRTCRLPTAPPPTTGGTDRHRIAHLRDIEPVHVGAYVEDLERRMAAPSVKLHLADSSSFSSDTARPSNEQRTPATHRQTRRGRGSRHEGVLKAKPSAKERQPWMGWRSFVYSVSPLPSSPNHQRLTPAGRAFRSTGGPHRSRAFARVPCCPLSCALNAPVTWRLLRPAQACRTCCARFHRSTALGPRSRNTPRRAPTDAA